MKSLEEIKQEVKKYILESTFGDKNNLSENTLIFREGYFDSMGFVSLIAYLEQTYSIQTSDEDLIEENFESMQAIVSYVQRKLS
jgi:acyl carrier protein